MPFARAAEIARSSSAGQWYAGSLGDRGWAGRAPATAAHESTPDHSRARSVWSSGKIVPPLMGIPSLTHFVGGRAFPAAECAWGCAIAIAAAPATQAIDTPATADPSRTGSTLPVNDVWQPTSTHGADPLGASCCFAPCDRARFERVAPRFARASAALQLSTVRHAGAPCP
jgi:hypothetical protein